MKGAAGAKSVVLLSESLKGGGAERQLVQIANHWVNRGERVILATWSGPATPDIYSLDPRVRRVHLEFTPSPGPFQGARRSLGYIIRLRRLLIAEQPFALLSFITENNVFAIAAAAGLDVRLVVSERADPSSDVTVPFVWRLLRRWFYRRSDLVVAQTARAAQWIHAHCHVEAAVIPNSLRSLREGANMREPLVIGVGRLTRQKGFDLLIDAFAGLQERFPQWRMVILGTGPEQAALQSQIDRHSLQARVSLQGFDSDIESWFARAGLVVQPSRFEGFPNVLLEAMGMGAAVISSDCPAGPSEIIQDGINGRLVPMEDVSALGAAMEALMRDAGARERLGEAAKAVRERFHVDLIMADWDRALFPSIAQESLST